MTHIVRFDGQVGVLARGLVAPMELSLTDLLALPVAEIGALVARHAPLASLPVSEVRLLAPVEGRMEVWGAGVTYERSRAARVEESGRDLYDAVYTAERPELFFKATPWRVTTDGEPAGIRADGSCVPEPELAIVANRHGEPVGAVVCDDLTARSVEGENPLYLPQAKCFAGSCGLSPAIRPWWELPEELFVELEVVRGGEKVFSGATGTRRLRRTPSELLGWLFLAQGFPDGVVLATGTGIVPPLEFSLLGGDEVTITISEVGVLRQRVAGFPA
ncbi:fumarylacetoacetate hydrolase family protein [Nonomuraea sp. NPDC049152]|uniref:fumarylacetoacetate hydrolase family protein n=1 Tax=Nonomuraea sp. NPDC049152 TaxID=3154350 RepID=UPI0033CA8AE6